MANLEQQRRVLADASNRENFLVKLQAKAQEDGVAGAEAQLGQMKDQFAKLKFNFVELEAKQLFHEYVVKGSFAAAVPDEEEAGRIKQKKKAVKERKVQCEQDITKLIEASIAAQHDLDSMCATYSGELEELEAMEADYARLVTAVEEQTKEIGEVASVGEVAARNEALVGGIRAAEGSMARMKPALVAAQEQKDAVAKEVEGLVEATTVARGQLGVALGSRAEHETKMADYATWYGMATEMMAGLTGVRIADCTEDRMVLEFAPAEGTPRPAKAVLHVDKAGRLLGAEMPSAAPELRAIAETAVAQDSIAYLVRETRAFLARK